MLPTQNSSSLETSCPFRGNPRFQNSSQSCGNWGQKVTRCHLLGWWQPSGPLACAFSPCAPSLARVSLCSYEQLQKPSSDSRLEPDVKMHACFLVKVKYLHFEQSSFPNPQSEPQRSVPRCLWIWMCMWFPADGRALRSIPG